jgi:hypothetical protein
VSEEPTSRRTASQSFRAGSPRNLRGWAGARAFEALAMASIKLALHVSEDELSIDLFVAEAVLEFGDDLWQVSEAAARWGSEERAAAAA